MISPITSTSQPFGVDFYLSRPVMKFTGVLTVHDDCTEFDFDFFDLNNTTPVKIPESLLCRLSKVVIESKNFGKERGEWVRN